MIEIEVPGRGRVKLEHLVLDVNGTLALDGKLFDEIPARLMRLKKNLQIHLLTADTLGKQAEIDAALELKAILIKAGDEAEQKAAFIRSLPPFSTVAIGQGSNDAGMLREAALGICVISPEGTARDAFLAADVIAPDINRALELLEFPLRLRATLRK